MGNSLVESGPYDEPMGNLPTLPAEAMEIVARNGIDRASATRKLRDVLTRAASGADEAASIRTISVLGSYARGAVSVGDIDLVIDIDDPRDERSAQLNDYYARIRGKNPDASLLRELRCSGSSMVSATIVRRFGSNPEPVSPEEWRNNMGPGYELARPPQLGHVVTNQPLAGPSHLLFVRGDPAARVLGRLASIKEDPTASRFERTTRVPLLDELSDQVGVSVQHNLAKLVLTGGLELKAVVLKGIVEPPEAVVRFEAEGDRIPGGKARRQVVLAAVDYLLEAGVEATRISLRGSPLAADDRERDVLVDWGTMTLYGVGEILLHEWRRVVFVILDSHRKGPWIGLECRVRSKTALAEADAAEARRISELMSNSSNSST